MSNDIPVKIAEDKELPGASPIVLLDPRKQTFSRLKNEGLLPTYSVEKLENLERENFCQESLTSKVPFIFHV